MASLLEDIKTICDPDAFHAHINCLTQQVAKHFGAPSDSDGWVSSYHCREALEERGYSESELNAASELYRATGRSGFAPWEGAAGHERAVKIAEELVAAKLVPA